MPVGDQQQPFSYRFDDTRVQVSSYACGKPNEMIWRDYNGRALIEKRIHELKADLAIDDLCMHRFKATETLFRGILTLFNLLAEFQKTLDLPKYRQPGTLRPTVFVSGGLLGKVSRNTVLLDNLTTTFVPTSPKFALPTCPSG